MWYSFIIVALSRIFKEKHSHTNFFLTVRFRHHRTMLLFSSHMQSEYQIKIKSSLYSPHYAEACNELRGPSPRLSAWATQLRRNVATVASRWRHCVDLTSPGIEPQTSRTDSECFATELTAGAKSKYCSINSPVGLLQ